MILLIDNFDSFTYNLVQYFHELGNEVIVKRNNEISIEAIKKLKPDHIVISPGPCTPDTSGISMSLIKTFAKHIPILGVCLGHQCLAKSFGAKIIHANKVMHGKNSTVQHNNQGVFKDLPQNFSVTRYHSLIVEPASLPAAFEITAWTDQQEIMAIKHKTLPLEGVQFHPEAILSEHGHKLLQQFMLY